MLLFMSEGSPHVKDVTETTFARDVLERSHTVPVVVDFWAAWCGPCRVLGPLLEKEVAALGGRVEMAKLDTDANPQLAAEFGIRSIPAVKAFRNGQLVDEFVGALPVPALREFLARLVPSAAKQGLTEAMAALQAGRFADAEKLLTALLDDAEVGGDAGFHLAHLLLDRAGQDATAIGRARDLASKVAPISDLQPRVEALLTLADFLAIGSGPDTQNLDARIQNNPRDHQARIARAARQLGAGNPAAALEDLLESISRDAKWNDGQARKAMVAVFDHLEEPGRATGLAREYRRKLQIVL